MRANLKKAKMIKSDPNKIILTVGMIVKNEEEHLDNCLSALKKLLDNVSSELIIVDTGSTDRTKEIALKYTDKVYDFEWTGDFSEARNVGLKKAKGEWFMFIDADEYLDEDCNEMISFFNMPEVSSNYNSASIPIINYISKKSKKTADEFLAPRIVRLEEGIEFHDPIHEWIPQSNPHGFFSTKLHHYGYVFDDKELFERKADRNVKPLMEEYKNKPPHLRTLGQVCDVTAFDKYFPTFEDKEKYHIEYIELAKKEIESPFAPGAFSKCAIFYINYKKYDKALEALDYFLDIEDSDNSVIILAIYYLKTIVYILQNDYENEYESLKKYFEYYEKYKKNELNMVALRFNIVKGITDYDYDQQVLNAAQCAYNLGKSEESFEYLNKVELGDMSFDHLRMYLNIVRDLIGLTKDYEKAAECYDRIQSLDDDDKTGLILFLLQQYYLEHPKEREDFADAMIKSGVKGRFIELMKLVKADNDGKDISDRLQKFIDSTDRWNDGYAEAIYLAMKHGCDLTEPINKMSHKLIRENLQYLSEGHSDYSKVVVDYYDLEMFSQSIKKLYWMVTAFELGVEGSSELKLEDKAIFNDTFVLALSDYVMNIYNPELLNPDDAEVLPELHRFGYYMTLAFKAQNEGDLIAYVRMLKEALRLCEPMKEVVAYYLSQLEEAMK